MKLKIQRQIIIMSKYAFIGLFLQCFLSSMAIPKDGKGQTSIEDIYITVQADNAKLKEVLSTIEKRTDFKFSYFKGLIDTNIRLDISAQNESLGNVLRHISKEAKLKFKRVNEYIYINKRANADPILEESLVNVQQVTITGTVIASEDNESLPGVSILIKGTSTGTSTDINGNYSLTASQGDILQFSYLGFITQEVEIGTQSKIDVVLVPDLTQLDEVIVTAIAIERQKAEIGYAVQGVGSDQLEQKAAPDAMNALQGKIAGVEIISSNGLPGANVQVFIRGLSSALGNNQPLMVIDGIPMDNSTVISNDGIQNGTSGGVYSNRSLDINPNDIASINVLKGPSAAALYGSRASNGVIMITTKKGSYNEKMSVAIASSVNFQRPSGLPRFQNEYGHGNNFEFQDNQNFSWGPRFGNPDYQTVTDFRGEEVAYQAFPNNVRDFFETGVIFDNNVSISGGKENTRYIFSGSDTRQRGVVPNSEMNRVSLRSSGSAKLKNGIKVESSLLYTNTSQQGTQLGNSGTSPFFILTFMPRSYDLQGIPYKDENNEQIFWSPSRDNPYWSVNESPYTSEVNRITGNATISYNPFEGLDFTYRAGLDQYSDNRREIIAFGSHPNNNSFGVTSAGGQLYDNINFREQNHDFFGIYKKDLTKDIGLRFLGGFQANERMLERLTSRAEALIVPNFYNLSNHDNANIQTSNFSSLRRLYAFYGQIGLSYKDYLFLEVQGRNDWSSTLPKNNNSYFYPSASLSFVFSEALDFDGNGILSYGKARLNYAKVGSDADPYQLQTVYNPASFGNSRINGAVSFPFNGVVSYALSSQLGNDNLNPEFTTSYEGGFELGFFDSRITADITYFDNRTTDQIIPLSIPGSSGYTNVIVNAGEISNKGIEAMVSARVLFNPGGLNWTVGVNFTKIENIVESLPEGIDQIVLPGSISGSGINATLLPGQPFGTFVGSKFVRDDQNRFVVNPRNLRIFTEPNQIVGDPNPDWWSSVTNTLTYKGLTLDVMMQFVKGGDIYSRTIRNNRIRGNLEEQAVNREMPWMFGNAVWGESDATPTAQPVNAQMTTIDYWRNISRSTETAIYDATILRLREITLSYAIPESVLTKTPFGSASVSISGRNLWWYAPNIKHVDPENNLGGGNSRGIEFQNGVAVQNYGFNLKFTF